MNRTVHIQTESDVFQHVETLRRNRHKRHQHGEFFVEGVRQLNVLRSRGWTVRTWIYASDQPLSDWAKQMLSDVVASEHYTMPLRLLAKLSRKETTSELIAIVPIPPDDLGAIRMHEDLCVVVLDRPSSPGNLGTILRSCDFLGVDGVIITGHSVDLYDPQVIAATAGAFFSQTVVRLPSAQAVAQWADTAQQSLPELSIVGTSAKGSVAVYAHDFTRPCIVLIGNETDGLSRKYRDLCDTMVQIPMSARSTGTSLNVASATTAVLYELTRQRATQRPRSSLATEDAQRASVE